MRGIPVESFAQPLDRATLDAGSLVEDAELPVGVGLRLIDANGLQELGLGPAAKTPVAEEELPQRHSIVPVVLICLDSVFEETEGTAPIARSQERPGLVVRL